MALNDPRKLITGGLSVLADPRPNQLQPPLADGVHLRWTPGRDRGFPPHGYYVFRRKHRDAGIRCLSDEIRGLGPGPLDHRTLENDFGRLVSPRENLLLTEDFPSPIRVEFDLSRHRLLQFQLPDGVRSDHVEVSIGLRGPPRPKVTHLGFDASVFGFRDAPLIFEGVEFRAVVGGRARPSIEGASDRKMRYFLRCEERLEILLPCNSPYVDVTRGAPSEHRIVAYNEDGSVAEVRESASLEYGLNRLNGEAIRRVVLEAPGALLYGISFRCEPEPEATEIEVLAFFERESDRQRGAIATAAARGMAGEIATVVLEAPAIDEIWIAGGPAALVDICYRSPDRRRPSQPGAWARVRGFDEPLTLPLTHPGYPASRGPEALETWRDRAEKRIQYGGPEEYLGTRRLRHVTLGDLRLEPGSALVHSESANWDESFVGRLIYPDSLDTAYAVMTVLGPKKLVLSRPFSGSAPVAADSYEYSADDSFAEIHDQLAALFSTAEGGMRSASMPPTFDRSDDDSGKRARLSGDGEVVIGENTDWPRDWDGLLIELGTDLDVYRIEEIESAQKLRLDRPFTGDIGTGAFRIFARSPTHDLSPRGPSLDLAPMDLLELAALDPGYAQLLGLYWIDDDVAKDAVYDYIVLADHGGELGGDVDAALRWLQAHPEVDDEKVDGSLVREIRHAGSGALGAPRDLRGFALPAGHQRLDLERPDLADSEPGLSVGELAEWAGRPLSERPVMLQPWRLELGATRPDPDAPPGPRAFTSRGGEADRFLASQGPDDLPVPSPEGWPDPRTIHYLDPALDVGWYAYRLHAIDLFGRHSPLSEPIPWYGVAPVAERHPYAIHLTDLTPPPAPTDVVAWVLDKDDPGLVEDDAYREWRARDDVKSDTLGLRIRWRWGWPQMLQAPDLEEFRIYYQASPINARPSRIESVRPVAENARQSEVVLALDDRSAGADAYRGAKLQTGNRSFEVLASRPAARLELVVRNGGPAGDVRPQAAAEATLVLTEGHDLHRDLFDPLIWQTRLTHVGHDDPANASVDHLVQMLPDESVVTYDAEDNTFRGTDARWDGSRITLGDLPSGRTLADVRPGIDVIALSSDAAGGRVLELESLRPQVDRLVLDAPPQDLPPGRYAWSIGPAEQLLEGSDAEWRAAYRTLTLESRRDLSYVRPGIDLVYLAATGDSTPARLDHFFGIESAGDDKRHLLLSDDGPGRLDDLQNGSSYAWSVGWPLRVYEIFLSEEERADPAEFSLARALGPTLSDPVVYGTVGVSAADRRAEVADRRTGAERPRPGNEGRLAGPATVYRVYRQRPQAPAEVDWDSRRLLATKADYQGKSYFTLRWRKPADPEERQHYKAHVFRALDDSLYLADWEEPLVETPSPGEDPIPPETFPARWPRSRRAQVMAELDPTDPASTYHQIHAAASLSDARELYDDLSDDAMAVLGSLDGSEEAFQQITIEPLSHTAPEHEDRLGPDDDEATFPGPDPELAAFLDSMDGRSTNRFLYRVAFVDPAQNLGPMGKSTPPVRLPRVVPPLTPVVTEVLGGDRQIIIRWLSNRESDLAGYRIYRAETIEQARDIRRMKRVGILESTAVEFIDTVTGLADFYYRICAFDILDNHSPASSILTGRSYDEAIPDVVPLNLEYSDSDASQLELTWLSSDETLLEARTGHQTIWRALTRWLPPGSQSFMHDVTPPHTVFYRLRIRKSTGSLVIGPATALSFPTESALEQS